MNFNEALAQMQTGESIWLRRSSWYKDRKVHIGESNKQNFFYEVANPQFQNWNHERGYDMSLDDILATDWELFVN
ncbi:MAG: hypothetical protein WC679_00680 [Bacteroidales bacterium]|jgi:hypothetical protein